MSLLFSTNVPFLNATAVSYCFPLVRLQFQQRYQDCVNVTGGLCRRGSDSEAASSGFTPPDAPFADAPEEPLRMIEREEIPEVLPVLVQQPRYIDYAG